MGNLVRCAYICLLLPWATLGHQATTSGGGSGSSQSAKPPAQSEVASLLESKIRASWEAFKKRDKKAYGEFLTDDYVAVEADGEGARNKMHMLRESESSMMTEYALSFFKVTPFSPDAAFVRYEAFFRFPPKSAFPFEKVYVGEVWVKRDGQWKSLHYQETRVK
jgi:ketosteroid isomerase-like protein